MDVFVQVIGGTPKAYTLAEGAMLADLHTAMDNKYAKYQAAINGDATDDQSAELSDADVITLSEKVKGAAAR